MNPRRQPAHWGGKPSVLHSQPSVGEHGDDGHPMGALGEREALPKRKVEQQVIVEPEGRSGAFFRTACCVLASAVCYYVATRIAWALCFPDSKVSLFFPQVRTRFWDDLMVTILSSTRYARRLGRNIASLTLPAVSCGGNV